MQSGADAMAHEPSGLLSDAKSPVDLVAGNAVLGVHNQPDSRKPLVQSKRGVFKNRAHLGRELLLAGSAVPQAAGERLALHKLATLERTVWRFPRCHHEFSNPVRVAMWAGNLPI